MATALMAPRKGANSSDISPVNSNDPGTCHYGVFGGSGQFVQVANNSLLDSTAGLAYVVWDDPSDNNALQMIMGKGQWQGNAFQGPALYLRG